MNTNQILNALAGTQHQSGLRAMQSGSPGGTTPFDELLEQARAGSERGTAPVKVAKGLDLKLNDEQLARIGAAVDLAEAHGGGRVMVLVDGRALQVDVATRTILSEAAAGKTASMPGVDAVVSAPADPNVTQSHGLTQPPAANATNTPNASVRTLLESRQQSHTAE